MSNSHLFMYGIFPYIAFIILLIGSWARFDRDQYSWRAGSSQMLRNNMAVASNFFHIGVIVVLLGHIVGLLTPEAVYHYFISSATKQLLAMIVGGVFGFICLIGLLMLMYRRMFDPRIRASSSISDIMVLWLLLIQLLLGLASIVVSTEHMDGSVMVQLATWAQSIVIFRPVVAAESIVNVHWIYKAHIFFGMCIFAVFPFTRLVHIFSAPIWYLGRNYQIVRQKRPVRPF